MLRCRPQAERSSFSAEVNWQETAHEKSLAPRVPPLQHILAKAPSTSTWTFPERKFLTDAKSGCFFIRWSNNIEPSSSPWILYSRWQPRCQVHSRPWALFYNACSVANFPSGVLGTRVKPDTCGRGNFWIRKEKVVGTKISGCMWRGPKTRRRMTTAITVSHQTHGHCLVLRNSRTRYVLGLLITSLGMWQPSEL